MATASPKEFGKYWLVQRIAAGGMAEIFKARYHVGGGLEKTCVVKRILPHFSSNPAFITMFHDEAAVCVRLTHANIAQVFDFGSVGGEHFLAMEYVQGQNLQRILRRLRERQEMAPVPMVLYIAAETAKGLNYAHTRKDEQGKELGIIHRDVSPANILVSYEGEVKLVDFGIAKAASQQERTQAGVIKGKASYMAPEYLLGTGVLDGRVDVFALGSVMWEMLCGRKLFTGDNEVEVINKVTAMDIEPPSTFDPQIRPAVDRVVMTALQRDPSKRYPNASEMHRDIAKVSAALGHALTQPDIGELVQTLFAEEMEKEMLADREISKTMVGLTVNMAPPTSLTPEPVLQVMPDDTSPSIDNEPSTLADSPMDMTAELQQRVSGEEPSQPQPPPTDLQAAAKRQAQRAIKAGVLRPPRLRRANWPLRLFLIFLLLVVLATTAVLFAPLFGIDLPIRVTD